MLSSISRFWFRRRQLPQIIRPQGRLGERVLVDCGSIARPRTDWALGGGRLFSEGSRPSRMLLPERPAAPFRKVN